MKTLNFILSLGLVIALASCGASKKSATETALDTNRDRRAALLADFKKKATGAAVKEAKKFEKDGYRAFLGDLPMEKQIENAWVKTVDVNASGYPEYIVGNAQVTAGNVTAAKSQALHAAKVEIASLTSAMIASLIESSVANNEVTNGEAQTLNKHLQASKELVVADLGQVTKDLEVYRELPNKNIQIITRLSYSATQALEAARQKLQKQMEGETQDLHRKLDKVFNFDRLQLGTNTNVEPED
ncbi:MAG: hypothetical protein LBS88_03695 [Tannerellaceae bacterium]|jgi:hypothetical protein|nr:hypothetical protein [Tannerellaceae bacterium]